jgi:hypothetical protein
MLLTNLSASLKRIMEPSSLIAPKLLGHADVSSTMSYTHVLNKGGRRVSSLLDV